MGRLVTVALWLLAAAFFILLSITVLIPRLLGWVPLTVVSGSMEPAIPVGSQIYVKPIENGDVSSITTGDIIAFMPYPDDETIVTHRVVGIGQDAAGQQSFVTQGDANNAPDQDSVGAHQVRGTVLYHVPFVGRLALAVDGGTKMWIVTGAAIALLAYAAWQLIQVARGAITKRNAAVDDDEPAPPLAGATAVDRAAAPSASEKSASDEHDAATPELADVSAGERDA